MLNRLLTKFRGAKPEATALPVSQAEVELNDEMQRFWHVTDYMARDEHKIIYRGLFMRIMRALESFQPDADMETNARQVLSILKEATYAARLRQDRLLPAGRVNTDYRKYESVYTHALVTAVAVEGAIKACGGVLAPIDASAPEALETPSEAANERDTISVGWAKVLIPKPGLDWLQRDSMVWEDWLAYFEEPGSSLMAELGRQGREWLRTGEHPEKKKKSKPSDSNALIAEMNLADEVERGGTTNRPKSAGWKIIDAIKESLADGSLESCLPDAAVQVDCDGRTFLQVPHIYEWYHEKYDPESAPNTIRNRMKKLGVLERLNSREIYQATVTGGGPTVEGVILNDSTLVWGQNVPVGSIIIQGLKGSA